MANQADLIRIPWRTNVPNLMLVSSFARFLSKIAVICPTIDQHLKEMGMGQVSAGRMARRRLLEYWRKVDAATCWSGTCSHT